MPDEELLRGAPTADRCGARGAGSAGAPHARRTRARRAGQDFGGQWLQFRALEIVAPDGEKFPDFDNYLRLSMRRETELFFERIVREDRSILDFLDAHYTFLNERLARHYGIAGVSGPEFRASISPTRTAAAC